MKRLRDASSLPCGALLAATDRASDRFLSFARMHSEEAAVDEGGAPT